MAASIQAVRRFSSLVKGFGFVNYNTRENGLRVINKSGSAISANKLVCINGYDSTSKHMKIVLANAITAGNANEVFVTRDAIANNAKGHVFKGFMSPANQNTNGATVGDTIYLGTTDGGFALTTAPSQGSARVVPVGYVHVVSSTVGQILWDVQEPDKFGSNDLASNIAADVTGAVSGTTQSTFYALTTQTVKANTLNANGKGFEFQLFATTAANANAKDFRLHFGAATVTLVTGSTASGKPVVVYGAVYRTSAGNQVVTAEITIDTTSATVVTTATADETTDWTFSLESQNTAAAAASATGKLGIITMLN